MKQTISELKWTLKRILDERSIENYIRVWRGYDALEQYRSIKTGLMCTAAGLTICGTLVFGIGKLLDYNNSRIDDFRRTLSGRTFDVTNIVGLYAEPPSSWEELIT